MPFCAENRLHYFFKPIIMVFDMMEYSMTPDFSPVRGAHVLIALSGGADSVALAVMLAEARAEYGLTLLAGHVDHGIRPESQGDAAFCADLCAKLDIPLFTARVDVPAEAMRTGEGIETAARRLRYQALKRFKADCDADVIVLAHHMDDQAETVLMHLARGAGPEGISGMREIAGDLYRPLLRWRKAALVEYLAERGFAWREDATNRVADNPRNALRLDAIPALERSFPGFVPAAARYARSAQIESDFVAEQTAKYLARCGSLGAFGAWLSLDPPPHPAILRRAIRALCPRELNFHQVEALEALCARARGKIDLGGSHFAERTGRRLYFVPKATPEIAAAALSLNGETALPGIGSVTARPGEAAPIRDDPRRQALNADALAGAVLRTRQPGDRIRPLGGGDKLLSDYFIDRKLDRPLRDMTPLVAVGHRVLWAVGLGIAQEARLTGGCPALILEYTPNTNDDGGKPHGE